jgi:hypothetical protein
MELKTEHHALKIIWATRGNRAWAAFKTLPFFQFLRKLPLAKGGFMWSLKVWRLELNWYVKPDKVPHKVGVARSEQIAAEYRAKQIKDFEADEIIPNQIVHTHKNHIGSEHKL